MNNETLRLVTEYGTDPGHGVLTRGLISEPEINYQEGDRRGLISAVTNDHDGRLPQDRHDFGC